MTSLDRTTNDGVWYQLTPDMEKHKIKVTREWIKTLIRKVCGDLGVTRESLGIFAGARATMYFNGNWRSVRFDDIEELAENGADILFVEKMPIVEVLTTYTDRYGVAIVNTQGFLTEYGKDLIRAIHKSGGNAAILTDYEDYGLSIVAKILDSGVVIPRVGVDESTLQYFRLSRDKLAISNQRRLKNYGFLKHFDDDVVDKQFVKTKRVEIDAILSAVGSKRLWEYIMYKLIEFFPTRDYNRVISMPANEVLYQKPIQDFLASINSYVDEILKDEHEKITEGLSSIEGDMIDVDEKNTEIQHKLEDIVSKNEHMKEISKTCKKLNDLINDGKKS